MTYQPTGRKGVATFPMSRNLTAANGKSTANSTIYALAQTFAR
jgi:hypothetical protein